LGGGLVKVAWLKHYEARELPQHFDRIVQSWDTANKATEFSDVSVCVTWGVAGKDLYLVDLLRRRIEYPELKREVRAHYERFKPSIVLIEDKASGTHLIQELIAEGLYAVTPYRSQTDKVMRSRRCQRQRLSRQAIPGRSPGIASPGACTRRAR
jgi:phage terminase large subunit-like protein